MQPTTLILGAGPGGLAMAAQLAQRGLPYTLLEATNHVGAAWREHYDRLHLHTVKQHSALPFLPYPAHYPTYVSREQVVAYLEQYARHFALQPLFNQSVTSIGHMEQGTRPGGGAWQVRTQDGNAQHQTFRADRVVVCTGYNRIPNSPDLPGLGTFEGQVMHSRNYRNGATLRGQRVLVVGMGNTGAEIALDLYEHGAQPTISVRGPVSIVRRDILGRPTQGTAIFLGKFPNWFYDFVAGLSQKLTVGDLSSYGLGKPEHPPSKLIREFGRIPVIDLGTLAQIKAGAIAVAPGIRQVNSHSVTFADGSERHFDAILLATGYRPGLSDLLAPPVATQVLNERGYPRALWFDDDPALRGLYFLGFATPLSGVLHSINANSGLIAEHMAAQTRPD
jgi:hypothetical protein